MSAVAPGDGDGVPPVDVALARLETTLAEYALDQALPSLDAILEAAGVTRELLREDDRAVKLLHEAIVARPLSTLEAVARVRTEVELLSLEVSVLRDRLVEPELSEAEVAGIEERMAEIEQALAELRTDL